MPQAVIDPARSKFVRTGPIKIILKTDRLTQQDYEFAYHFMNHWEYLRIC